MSRPEVRLRCPLTWPEGWPRVRPGDRQRGLFHQRAPAPHGAGAALRPVGLTVPAAIDRLRAELDRLGAVPEVLTTHHPVRLDGRLRTLSDRELAALDPGAAVYFSLKGEPRVLACDFYTRLADNVAALAAHIDALRAIERYHVGTLDQVFRAYTALPASTPTDWPSVLGVDRRTATRDVIEAAWRRLAKLAHPDVTGGEHDQMARLNTARDAALNDLGWR